LPDAQRIWSNAQIDQMRLTTHTVVMWITVNQISILYHEQRTL